MGVLKTLLAGMIAVKMLVPFMVWELIVNDHIVDFFPTLDACQSEATALAFQVLATDGPHDFQCKRVRISGA